MLDNKAAKTAQTPIPDSFAALSHPILSGSLPFTHYKNTRQSCWKHPSHFPHPPFKVLPYVRVQAHSASIPFTIASLHCALFRFQDTPLRCITRTSMLPVTLHYTSLRDLSASFRYIPLRYRSPYLQPHFTSTLHPTQAGLNHPFNKSTWNKEQINQSTFTNPACFPPHFAAACLSHSKAYALLSFNGFLISHIAIWFASGGVPLFFYAMPCNPSIHQAINKALHIKKSVSRVPHFL